MLIIATGGQAVRVARFAGLVRRIGLIGQSSGMLRVDDLGECRTNAGLRDHGDTDCWVNRENILLQSGRVWR